MATGDKKPVVMEADRGVANGVATLGADAKLNDSQIPMQKIMAVANAAEYSQTQTYVLGAYCTRDGKLYRCTTEISAVEVWTAAHWTETTVGAELVDIYTALQNKAPAGYGLGANAATPTTNDADSCTLTGWYAISSMSNCPVTYGLLRVERWYGGSIFQTAYEMSSGVVVQRRYQNSEWKPWEYVNPPMQLGVEYRTTERYMGKPVYVKLVDCGLIVNGKKQVTHGTANCDYVIRTMGCADKEAMPRFLNSSWDGQWNAYFGKVTNTVIELYGGSSATGQQVYCTMWYTKTTD